jgi:hypothetical protein
VWSCHGGKLPPWQREEDQEQVDHDEATKVIQYKNNKIKIITNSSDQWNGVVRTTRQCNRRRNEVKRPSRRQDLVIRWTKTKIEDNGKQRRRSMKTTKDDNESQHNNTTYQIKTISI